MRCENCLQVIDISKAEIDADRNILYLKCSCGSREKIELNKISKFKPLR